MHTRKVSNLEREPVEALAGGRADVASEPVREVLEGREVVLGGPRGMPVVRTLPNKVRRMVGAWCFVDHFVGHDQMVVPPHPHTGLQTVTWLVEGRVRHRDSLGSDQVIAPGQLNLMTAGRGIAHAETSPVDGPSSGGLHGGPAVGWPCPTGTGNPAPRSPNMPTCRRAPTVGQRPGCSWVTWPAFV